MNDIFIQVSKYGAVILTGLQGFCPTHNNKVDISEFISISIDKKSLLVKLSCDHFGKVEINEAPRGDIEKWKAIDALIEMLKDITDKQWTPPMKQDLARVIENVRRFREGDIKEK